MTDLSKAIDNLTRKTFRVAIVSGGGGGGGTTGGLTNAELRATPVPITGTVAVSNLASGGLTDTQLRATPVPISGTVTISNPTAQGLTDAQLRATPVPVSGTVAISNQVSQPLTDTQLRATTVPVSGTVAISNQVSQPLTDTQLRATAVPVSAASLPLPSGAATESTVAAINTKTPSLGQAAMVGSVPVTIASNQTAVPISASSLPLPTGATTETTLAAMSAKLPATLGTKTIANALALSIASDQTVPVSAASLPLPSGAATSAAQTTGNNSLASIDAKFGSLGQKAMSGSAPVVIASDQSIIPTNPRASTTGGATPYKLISAATTNATSVKASAGQLYSIIAIGTTANIRYLKFYNKASAPTVGTDVPVLTIPVPGNTQGAGVAIHFTVGTVFSTGLAFAITAGVGDADSAAVGAGDVVVNLTYA